MKLIISRVLKLDPENNFRNVITSLLTQPLDIN